MRPPDLLCLVALAAIWGASFLFMRVAAPAFGPVPLVLVRCAGAALCLLPLFLRRENRAWVARHPRALLLVGLLNSALPFSLLAFATLHVEAGFAALLNATVPLWAGVVGAVWFGVPWRRAQVGGLLLGVAGVVVLAWGRLGFRDGGTGWAVVAALAATLGYAVSGHLTRRRLPEMPPAVVAGGSLLGATAVLLVPGVVGWPAQAPPPLAWGAAAILAVGCTAGAYLLYFRLLARVGVNATATVTFLIPPFAIGWGSWLLGEPFTWRAAAGMLLTGLGTALTLGLLGVRRG